MDTLRIELFRSRQQFLPLDNFLMKGFIIFLFSHILGSITAQDVVTLKNGDEFEALIQEIGDIEIKYKRIDNPNGPNYSLKKSEVFMIKYANGTKDVFVDKKAPPTNEQKNLQKQAETSLEPLSIQGIKIYDSKGIELTNYEVRDVLKNVPSALNEYKSGRALKGAGVGLLIPQLILFAAGIGVGIYEISNYNAYYDDRPLKVALPLLGSSIAFGIPSLICSSSGNKKIRNSIATYNKGISQKQTSDVNIKLGIMQAGGVGLLLNF